MNLPRSLSQIALHFKYDCHYITVDASETE